MVGGRAIGCQAKQICYNVYLHYKKRKQDRSTIEFQDDINLMGTVAEVTGFSKTTVVKIVKEANLSIEQTGSCSFKPRERKNVRKKRIDVGKYKEELIRRKAVQFYTEHNKVPTLRKLNQLLKDENIISCSVEYLRQLLRKIGFNGSQNRAKKVLIVEKPEIVVDRCNYLQAISDYRAQNRNIFYLNETKFWQLHEDENSSNLTSVQQKPSIIIVDAGRGDGFIDGSLIMLKPKHKNKEDPIYEHFDNYDWINDRVLSNLTPSSVIVTNIPPVEPSASEQQDSRPISSSTRSEIQDWLDRHNICYHATDSKAELLELINSDQKQKEFSIEKALEEGGHTILHLPQNHSDLNPVILAWDELDNDSEETTPIVLFNNYSRNGWQKCFDRVMRHETEHIKLGTKSEEGVNNLAPVKKRSNPDEGEIYSDDGDSNCESEED